MTTIKACLTGCTIRNEHLTTCETRNTKTNPCRGCLPRQAEYGNLCPWCWQRLHADTIDAANLVKHLRFIAEPDAAAKPPSDGRSHGDPAEADLIPDAINAADEIHSTLAAYAQLVIEEHPHGHVMRGPDLRGVWITQATIHTDEYGTYIQKATAAGIRDTEATTRLVKWLLPLLPWCAEQDWAGVMRSELASTISTTMARWPTAETRLVKVKDVLCPRCDRASLTYMPPAYFRQELVIACVNPECGRVFREDEYARLIGLLDDAERKIG